MTNRSLVKITFLTFSLLLAFNLGTYAQKTDCSKMTDAQVVDSIYSKIKVKYAAQMNHINVRIASGVVTIEGWATTKSVKKDIEKLAKKVACVKSVKNTLTIGISGGCAAGQKPCGDICISTSDTCNIRNQD